MLHISMYEEAQTQGSITSRLALPLASAYFGLVFQDMQTRAWKHTARDIDPTQLASNRKVGLRPCDSYYL